MTARGGDFRSPACRWLPEDISEIRSARVPGAEGPPSPGRWPGAGRWSGAS